MSISFAFHSQIVCVILENNRNNDHFSKRGGMRFGMRYNYVNNEEGDVIVTTSKKVEVDTLQ